MIEELSLKNAADVRVEIRIRILLRNYNGSEEFEIDRAGN